MDLDRAKGYAEHKVKATGASLVSKPLDVNPRGVKCSAHEILF